LADRHRTFVQPAGGNSVWNSPRLLLWGGVIWCILVMAGYYYVHKPVRPENVAALVLPVARLLAALGLAGVAGGLGRRLYKAGYLAPLERFAIQAALGWGTLGLIWYGLGWLGGYNRIIAWGGLLTGAFFLRREILAWLEELKAQVTIWNDFSRLGRVLVAIAGFQIIGQLLLSLAPPVRWDALVYHLELPRRYLEAGGLAFLPWNPHGGQPQLAEMIYTWGMGLGGAQTAAVLGWLFQTILLVGIAGTATRIAGPGVAWPAVIALLSGYSFRWLMSAAYSDGLAALFGYASLALVLYWIEEPRDEVLVLSGLLAGFAVFSKLTAGILLFSLAAGVLTLSKLNLPGKGKRIFLFTAPALAVLAPWLLANTFSTGNPLYPYLYPTAWIMPDRLEFFRSLGTGAGWQALYLPLAVTWFGLDTNPVTGMAAYASDLGPVLVLLAVPGVAFHLRHPHGRLLAAWLACGWIGMAVGGWYSPLLYQTRLYFCLLPAAALAAGLGWQYLNQVAADGVRMRIVLGSLVILVSGLGLWQDLEQLSRLNPLQVLFTSRGEEAFLDESLGSYGEAMAVLDRLPSEDRALFLWEPRGLYAPRTAVPDSWIDRWYLDRAGGQDPAEILQNWRSQGFTHMLVNRSGAEYERTQRAALTPSDWQAFDSLLQSLPAPEFTGRDHLLYRLTP
jgi:hypothetical protein